MATDANLRGVYIPIITPFAEDGSVAIDALQRLCHEYLDAGAAGIVALGTTGESTALDADEKRAVIDACARICAERSSQLIVGAGTNNTRTTRQAVKELAGTPALVATLIVVPYYVRPSEAGVLAHFRDVADVSPVPIVIYNIAIRTGRHLSAAGVAHLANSPNFAGIKQAATGLDLDTLELLRATNHVDGFCVLGGEDPFLFPLVLMGGAGTICASAHVCTSRFVEMIECGLAGKVDEGRAHAEALLPVTQALFAEPNPAVFKGVLHAQGRIPTADVRLPLVNASSDATQRAVDAIVAAS
ncbi:MAG TPA: 4-hydroxy-tetrahydrodipicolinate synthase [Acidimicrobiia bacterium]|jgi:4-hydroxy-tetrahydrodipicolinate synthase|nr:4-hydroxy-tetrahydrodipicolinate synthase [Acidimicrobiia bacterium]